MADKLTRTRRSWNMSRIRSRDTRPELCVRRLTYSLGYRYRLHFPDLPGKPDLVFLRQKKAIFVHGCFWHQHPRQRCHDSRTPKSSLDYWLPKLKRNVRRDAEDIAKLKKLGWKVMTLWECEVTQSSLKRRIKNFLR